VPQPAQSRRVARRDDADRRFGLRLALGGLAAFLVAVPFTLLLLLVESKWQPLENLDGSAARRLNQVARANRWLVDVLDVVSTAFQPWVFRLLVLGVAAWLWARGARRLAVWAAVTMAVGGVLGVVLKIVVVRARPVLPEPVAHASGYSFPSGHALNSMLGVAVLIVVLLPVLGRAGRVLACTAGALVVLLTGFDRVALGVHYVSDVLAGWVVALACVAATAAAFAIWRREEGRRPSTPAAGLDPDEARRITDSPNPVDRDHGEWRA
jgi:membrane-associated phospholipid phosphatase